jgi:hypothetical protein
VVKNPAEGMDVCRLWVLIFVGTGLCVRLITLPEESKWQWCLLSLIVKSQ